MQGPLEIEVKIRLPRDHQYPQHLVTLGFREHSPRVFEANTIYDTPGQGLRSRGEMLRIREMQMKAVLTWKGKGIEGPHKSRPEIETALENPGNLHLIFERLGYTPIFRYEKYRTEFEREPGGLVTFDETPIGHFLELEGEPAWIDRTAHLLGFSQSDFSLESYGKLYSSHCEKLGISPQDMVFKPNT